MKNKQSESFDLPIQGSKHNVLAVTVCFERERHRYWLSMYPCTVGSKGGFGVREFGLFTGYSCTVEDNVIRFNHKQLLAHSQRVRSEIANRSGRGWDMAERVLLETGARFPDYDPRAKRRLIPVIGELKSLAPAAGDSFNLAEMYEAVETDIIEIVRLDNDMILIIDEEGKLKEKPRNPTATRLAAGAIMRGDSIVGNAIYCHTSMVK